MAKTKQNNNKDDKLTLLVEPRLVFGKKLNRLRKEGKTPANIYGPDFKSTAVSVEYKDLLKIYKVARETSVVYLMLKSDQIPVLIKNIQKHPVSDQILHVDFRKIDLAQKVQTEVPIKIIGQSAAVTQKGGVILTLTEILLVEALPTDIPKNIEVDIASLTEIGQEIKVSQLKTSAKFEIKTLSDKVVVSVVEHKEESVTPETAPTVTPEVITAKPEEGEVPAEGAPAEGVKSSPSKTAGGKSTAKTPDAKSSSQGKPAQPAKPAAGKK